MRKYFEFSNNTWWKAYSVLCTKILSSDYIAITDSVRCKICKQIAEKNKSHLTSKIE